MSSDKSVRVPFWRLQLKSVQTSAVVCADCTCSLHRLRRGFEFRKCNIYIVWLVKSLSHRNLLGEYKETLHELLNAQFSLLFYETIV